MPMNRAMRQTMQDAGLLSGLWATLGFLTGAWVWSALFSLLLALGLTLRARIILHDYAETRDEKLLPFLNGLESDIAYKFHKREREVQVERGELLERLGHIEAALAAVDRGFILVGENNYLRWWNASAQKLLDLNAERDLGRPLDNYLRDPAFEVIMGKLDGAQQVVATSPKDDRRTLELSVFPQAPDGKVVIIRDITRMKQLEQTRADFASNVSHELKTPITVIKGYAETLKDLVDGPKPLIKAFSKLANRRNGCKTLSRICCG